MHSGPPFPKFKKVGKNAPKNTTNPQEKFVQPNYHEAPKTSLPAFPDAKKVPGKTPVQGGGKLRDRWADKKHIYEWDAKKGRVEMYNKTGKKHLGEFDPYTGEKTGNSKSNRRVEK